MKKFNNIRILDTDGKLVFEGSYIKLLNKFNNDKEKCNDYIADCKEKGFDYNTRTIYYDFIYDCPSSALSENWFEDICNSIIFEGSLELVEEIILKSFKQLKKVKCRYIGNKYLLVVLPKQYDSIILYCPYEFDYKFFANLLRIIYCNLNGKHNKTLEPKIRVAEFVNNWREKIKYSDYNEGYTFYYNSIPDENKIDLLLK